MLLGGLPFCCGSLCRALELCILVSIQEDEMVCRKFSDIQWHWPALGLLCCGPLSGMKKAGGMV